MTGYKVILYGPEEALQSILQGLASLGLGRIGNYDSWSVTSPVTERYRPLAGSLAQRGQTGALEEAPSFRIELQCRKDELEKMIEKIKELHPYETPAIEVLELFYPTFEN